MQLFIRFLSRSCFLLWTLSAFAMGQIDELSATVDKNPVLADESITLTVMAKGSVSRDAFDPSVLNTDFIVGRTSVSSQTQMINFDTTRTTTWTTSLIPRKPGRYTIPAFTIEDQSSQPINMMILPVSARQNHQQRDVYVTTAVDTHETYLQQQVRYTVKLMLAADLQRGSLSTPTLEGSEIRQIGKDAEYNDIVDGKRYRVIERTFAVIPQKSGTFTIQGPVFEGEVVQSRQQNFGFFNRSKTISRVGPAQEITVKPIPQNFSGAWLPSEYVELHEEWQPEKSKFIAGEPITRTLTLTAVGVDEAQLPNITSQYPTELKVYPNQPNTTTVEKDNTLIAQRTQTLAIIPSHPGEFTLDEVKIPWFNIVSEQVEYATLPPRTITVAPASNTQASAPSEQSNPPSLEESNGSKGAPSPSASKPNTTQKDTSWFWVSIALLILWLGTLLGWILHAKRLRMSKDAVHTTAYRQQGPTRDMSEKKAWSLLNNAISKQDTSTLLPALTSWLNILTNQKDTPLPKLQEQLQNAQLNRIISTLYGQKFSPETHQWRPQELTETITQIRQKMSNNPQNEHLKALY